MLPWLVWHSSHPPSYSQLPKIHQLLRGPNRYNRTTAVICTTSASAKYVDCLKTGLPLHKTHLGLSLHRKGISGDTCFALKIISISFQRVLWKHVMNILNNLAASKMKMKRLLGTEQWRDPTLPITYCVTGYCTENELNSSVPFVRQKEHACASFKPNQISSEIDG